MYKKAILAVILANLVWIMGIVCEAGVRWSRVATTPAFRMKLDASYTADEKSSIMGVADMSASPQRVVEYEVLERKEREEDAAGELAADGQRADEAEELAVSGQRADEAEELAADGQRADEAEELAVSGPGVDMAEGLSSDPVYQLEEDEYELLLRIVEAEAGCEDEDGRLLVANVVFNRVNSEKFPDTVSEVILQKHKGCAQFSPVDSGRIWKVEISETTTAAVQRALEGEDISQGALYFAARSRADSENMKWFDEELTFLFQHGGHEFFS